MAAEIRVTIPAGLQEGDVLFSDEIAHGLRDASLIVEGEAKHLAPVSVGNLRRSIMSQVVPLAGKPTGIIAAQANYAPFVEYGTRPHTPPMAPIKRWAERHGANPWAIWGAIRKRGTRKHPFLVPALEEKRSAVLDRLQKAIARAVQRMSE